MVDPGKYEIYGYTCEQLNDDLKTVTARELELQKLMARSSRSPGGEFIGEMVYSPDYIQARGQKNLVIKPQAEKMLTKYKGCT